MSVKDAMRISERLKSSDNANLVYIRGNNQYVIPLEHGRFPEGHPRAGMKKTSWQQRGQDGSIIMEEHIRPIELGPGNVQILDLRNDEDAELWERVQDWYTEGKDYRIAKYGVMISEAAGGAVAPFSNYDLLSEDAIVKTVESFVQGMVDSGASDQEIYDFLLMTAEYEYQRVYPADHEQAGKRMTRQSIIDAIDDLQISNGPEGGLEDVDEE